MKKIINLFKTSNSQYYLSIDKNISNGNYAIVCHSELKAHYKPKRIFFSCIGTQIDETINDDIIVKIPKRKYEKVLSQEINNLLELQDEPHIIHIIKFENTLLYDKYYFATECCKGGDLCNYYLNNDKIFNEEEVKIIMKQLILAIRECHRHNIIHGDLKLENIGLVRENDISFIKLLDFGGAIKITKGDNLCEPNKMNIQASRHYIPPELKFSYTLHEKDLIYIDFWELGVIMYALLTKQFPYERVEKINKIVWPKNMDYISPEMKSIVEKLLVKNPLERCNIDLMDLF